ncbi:MAG: single-stranded-DNA-specific exonuclease RecJ [Succinimonas sp.]|nr:single-stranded-DNA-specific exonuclease RecJ [Succinimonas sp.]
MKIHRRTTENLGPRPKWQLDPVLTELFWKRGIKSTGELSYSLRNLLRPDFKDIERASEIIGRAVMTGEKIRVIGDYDVDGASATALAMRFFQDVRFEEADFYIPKRQDDGYGFNAAMAEKAAGDNVSLIITVDNGVSAHEAVSRARDLGLKVVITDHHIPGEKLPEAEAVVDPKRPDCPFRSKNIAGVGVIFYVLSKTRSFLREQEWFQKKGIPEPRMQDYLDLVALGTVADVVPLDYNNRIMVQYGIGLIRKHSAACGIEELVRLSGVPAVNFTSSDISFSLSPKLNAAGRIDDMTYGVDCLTARDPFTAKRDASILYNFNIRRREIENEMMLTAEQLIQTPSGSIIAGARGSVPGRISDGIVIFSPDFHAGISGIIAAKLKDRYRVPVIVLAAGIEEHTAVGSCRSVEGFSMHAALECLHGMLPDVVLKYGGHARAAGLTLRQDGIALFREKFQEIVRTHLKTGSAEETIESDGELPGSYFIPSFVRTLVYDQPWGEGFPNPVFDGVFYMSPQTVFKKHLRFRLSLMDGRSFPAVYFYYDERLWPNQRVNKVRAVYCFQISSNSDTGKISLIVRALEPLYDQSRMEGILWNGGLGIPYVDFGVRG